MQASNPSSATGLNNEEPAALAVKGGYKSFSKQGPPVLNDFSMRISKGSVYALLGSSGCGKTTLISCVLGFSNLDKGEIIYNIGGEDTYFPSNKLDVGYMPQEISLYTHLSIEETLEYFGNIFGVEEVVLRGRIDELLKLLSLPGKHKMVGKLSGGERKRVSLAVALIHQPRLLILDEPTSGVDPLLRSIIWQHLRHLAEVHRVTVLLTTHYTEEARHADFIGAMRNGRLVAEESPKTLVQNYNTNSLEQAILLLWKSPGSLGGNLFRFAGTSSGCIENGKKSEVSNVKKIKSSLRRIKALVWKNLISMWRHVALLCFIIVMPAVITLITCTTYRNDPQNIPLGIVNEETFCNVVDEMKMNDLCLVDLSCKFLEELSLSSGVRAMSYQSSEMATAAVKSGSSYGILRFPKNFTDAFVERVQPGSDEFVQIGSTIEVQLDQTNTLIHGTIMSTLYTVLEKFLKRISKECGLPPQQGAFPLQYKSPPLVGRDNLGILDFVAPGFSFAWLYFFPLISISIRLIGEKRQGTMTRTLTPGTNGEGTKLWEFLLAYMVTEIAVVLVQAALTFGILNGIFLIGAREHTKNPNDDDVFLSISNILAVALFILGGVSGVCCGCLLGLLCSQEIQAALLAIAIFFPNSFISGLVWPVEGMPLLLQYISPFLPFALPSEALRSLLNRGWEFTHPSVWPGFLVASFYKCFYIILIILMNHISTIK